MNFDVTLPVLTAQDMPWSLPSTGLYYGLRCSILNVPNDHLESVLPKILRIIARTTYTLALMCFTYLAVTYHLSMAVFYKLRSFTASPESFERAFRTALAWEYFKAGVMDCNWMPLFYNVHDWWEPTGSWLIDPNDSKVISYNLSRSEIRVDSHQTKFPEELARTHELAKEALDEMSRDPDALRDKGLHIYNFFIRRAYKFNELVDAKLKVSIINQQQFLSIPLDDDAVIQMVHTRAFANKSVKKIDDDLTILPSTFKLEKDRLTYPLYPSAIWLRVLALVKSVAVVLYVPIFCVAKGLPLSQLSNLYVIIPAIPAGLLLAGGLIYSIYKNAQKSIQKQNGAVELAYAKNLLATGQMEAAVHWFGEAAKNGYAEAQRIYGLARMISNDKRCESLANVKEGLFWLAQAAKQYDARAFHVLLHLMELPVNADVNSLLQPHADPLKQILFKHEGPVSKEEAQDFFKKLMDIIVLYEEEATCTQLHELHQVFHQERVDVFNTIKNTQFFIDDISEIIANYVISAQNPRELALAIS